MTVIRMRKLLTGTRLLGIKTIPRIRCSLATFQVKKKTTFANKKKPSIKIDPIEAGTIEAVTLYKAQEFLAIGVPAFLVGNPAVALTCEAGAGFVVMSLPTEVDRNVGAKIVSVSGGITGTFIQLIFFGAKVA